MGCDIHCFAEVFRFGAWRPLLPLKMTKDGSESYPEMEYIYHDRDYDAFTFLAGVRDYGSQIPVLSAPRGIPSDISPEVSKVVERWGDDGHSDSWLTVKELHDALGDEFVFPVNAFCLDSDWDKLIKSKPEMRTLHYNFGSLECLVPIDRKGIIRSYWLEKNKDEGSSQSVHKFGKIMEFDGLRDLVKRLSKIERPQSTSRWQRLCTDGEPDNFNSGFFKMDEVRIVFFFDN